MAWGPRQGIELRGAVALDAGDVARLLRQPEAARNMAERLEAIARDPHGTLLVAADYGPVVGLIALHWHPVLQQPRPVARISALVVAAEERHRGIGRMLLKAGSQAARQAGCDGLEMLAESDEARGFCTATGFQEIGHCFSRSLRKRTA
jgi:N-acetylglutamate synthase-like GNAT family acetyltransferase